MPRPQNIAYALFDFDGVIADTEPLFIELDAATLRHFGYEASQDELLSFMGKPSELCAQALLAERGISIEPENFLAVRDITSGIYANPSLQPMPGIARLWQLLHERGVRIAAVSTTCVANITAALNRFGLMTYVDVLVGRELVTRTKPDPDPYLTALGYLAPSDPYAAAKAIAFEDSPTGIASAQAAGIWTVGFTGSAIKQDASAANEQCASWADFAASLGR